MPARPDHGLKRASRLLLRNGRAGTGLVRDRSEEHTSELQSLAYPVCRLLLEKKNDKLWYNQPARTWNEALPVGNGRLGAMVFGKVDEELIQLNEETLWSGGPVNNNPNPLAQKVLPQIRDVFYWDDFHGDVHFFPTRRSSD